MKSTELAKPSPAVSVFGWARLPNGTGQAMRTTALALESVGVRLVAHAFVVSNSRVGFDHSIDHLISATPRDYPINIFHFTAIEALQTLPRLPAQALAGKYNIGFWFWELAKFPEEWLPAFDLFDEIWVASEFVRDALLARTSKPIKVFPLPVMVAPTHALGRDAFGIPANKFAFLCSFDLNSYASRKNPIAVIAAFQSAFAAADAAVTLVVKLNARGEFSELRQTLDIIAARDPRIVLIDRVLARHEVECLQNVCDAFVSLHRSEGYGLNIAECMALGKPVIATAYSGNMQFMNERNACPVRYALVPERAGEYIGEANQEWAEPDLEHAALLMQRLVADAAYRHEIGAAARRDMAQQFSQHAYAHALHARLVEIQRDLAHQKSQQTEHRP